VHAKDALTLLRDTENCCQSLIAQKQFVSKGIASYYKEMKKSEENKS
jgi:hypothetical protein